MGKTGILSDVATSTIFAVHKLRLQCLSCVDSSSVTVHFSMFVNLMLRYYLGLLMYTDFMTGCCFWHILDCMQVEACKRIPNR